MTNAKEVKDGLAYEVVIRPAVVPEKKPSIASPAKEITKEIVNKKLVDAAHRKKVRVGIDCRTPLTANGYLEIVFE